MNTVLLGSIAQDGGHYHNIGQGEKRVLFCFCFFMRRGGGELILLEENRGENQRQPAIATFKTSCLGFDPGI